jgi:hypothetical protein
VGHPLADSARDPREPVGPPPLQEPLESQSLLLAASPLQGSSSFWLSSESPLSFELPCIR